LYNILWTERGVRNIGRKEDNMIIPSRRKLGAAALIIAGIGAFLVPFLMHSPSTQGTSSNNNNGGTNPNNGSHTTTTTPTTPTTTTPTNPGTTDSKGPCSEDKAKDPSPGDNGEGKHKGNAFGVLKNQMDKTVALVKAMGTHNTAFHSHHDTKTDNHTVHAHAHHASSENSNDHDSSCAEKEETNDD
jgi:hypothetical protein